jgi:hypothetical protein
MKKEALTQPLMMRCDYGKKEKKDAMMIKEIPIADYDSIMLSDTSRDEGVSEDYDLHKCSGGCLMCDR